MLTARSADNDFADLSEIISKFTVIAIPVVAVDEKGVPLQCLNVERSLMPCKRGKDLRMITRFESLKQFV